MALRILLILCCFFNTFFLLGQGVEGYVRNENNDAVPFVNVFVQKTDWGTSTDSKGYFYLRLDPGNYDLTFSSVGYNPRTVPVVVRENRLSLDVIIETSSIELDQIVVRSKRKDPAYEIMQLVIDNKEQYLKKLDSYQCDIYLRAVEDQIKMEKGGEPEADRKLEGEADMLLMPELETEKDTSKQKAPPNVNLLESKFTLHYQYPDKFKELHSGRKRIGNTSGVFVPLFHRSDFNFYENMVFPDKISETAWISPLNTLAILSYKYKLEEAFYVDAQLVYKIRVTPRKKGNSTLNGYLYINDGLWNVRKLELTAGKGGLKFYDEFTVRQDFALYPESNIWLLQREEFEYKTKSGRKTYNGNTLLLFSNYEINKVFPSGFFNDEVARYEKDADEKDTVFWREERSEPLNPEQMKAIAYHDSVQAAQNSDHYLDSMEVLYNKIKPLEVLWEGVGFSNRTKEQRLTFGSLANMISPFEVGGFRINPYFWYNKRFDSGKLYGFSLAPNYGFRNRDLKGRLNFNFLFDPFSYGFLWVSLSRNFSMINNNDAYLNMIRRDNYYERIGGHIFMYKEIVNGLRLNAGLEVADRRSIENYQFGELADRYVENNLPTTFEGHRSIITSWGLAYTHRMKYIMEPKRKVYLGSKYPRITLTYKKGINELLGSGVDFDFLSGKVDQTLRLRTLGNLRYQVESGQFVNSRNVRLMDHKRFRQSDPYLFSNPIGSFQLLDTTLISTKRFVEGHFIHHFNGALVNNIPLVKKLRIYAVAGGGFLWLQENGYRMEELFVGLERMFKLGPRRRLRLGVYGVAAESNFAPAALDWKVSFDIIDTWKTNWSF